MFIWYFIFKMSRSYSKTLSPTHLPFDFQGVADVLIDGTAEGISQHVKAQFERGGLMVEKVRNILYDLGENPDEFCPIAEGDKPWACSLGGPHA